MPRVGEANLGSAAQLFLSWPTTLRACCTISHDPAALSSCRLPCGLVQLAPGACTHTLALCKPSSSPPPCTTTLHRHHLHHRPSQQRRYSVCLVDNPGTYERGRPKVGGLSDPRLGTMDRSYKCETDGSGPAECPGYFGHIALAKPMYHAGFIKTVLKTLRCVSYHNSRIMVTPVGPATHPACSSSSSGRAPHTQQRSTLLTPATAT